MSKNNPVRNSLIIAAAVMAVTASFITVGCTNNKTANKGIVEIGDRMFITQVNDVYLNAKDYMGKTIKLEGIFKCEDPYNFVVRYGFGGCCGADANVGFEVMWDKTGVMPYPAADSWVEATGVLKSHPLDSNSQYLYLDLASLNVLDKRGLEFVFQ
jgi:uncharacterized membrane protein YcgQ (UPF0703/DUF1980 family)